MRGCLVKFLLFAKILPEFLLISVQIFANFSNHERAAPLEHHCSYIYFYIYAVCLLGPFADSQIVLNDAVKIVVLYIYALFGQLYESI